jgi:hypothetical protein
MSHSYPTKLDVCESRLNYNYKKDNMQSLIFEKIKSSNKQYTFGRGKCGEFEVIIMDNGYINATKLCALGGKKLYNWLANDKVKDMINYFETMIGNSINLFIDEDEFIKFIHESYNERLTI